MIRAQHPSRNSTGHVRASRRGVSARSARSLSVSRAYAFMIDLGIDSPPTRRLRPIFRGMSGVLKRYDTASLTDRVEVAGAFNGVNASPADLAIAQPIAADESAHAGHSMRDGRRR
jgi:hypothetical protein